MTTFSDRVYQLGGVPVSGPIIQGKVWFVRPVNGVDTYSGKTPQRAFKTLAKALSVCTANQNDVVYLMSEGNASALCTDYQTDTLDWNVDGVHLIGINSGSIISPRSRIAWKSTASSTTDKPLFTLSANNCRIENIAFFAGIDDANLSFGMKVTGDRNVIKGCHIAGIGHDTNDAAGAYSLQIVGGDENLFEDCVIGLDTIARGTAANHEILLSAGSNARNIFRKSKIITYAEATGHVFVKRVSGGSDRFTLFEDVVFINTGTSTMAQAFDVTAGGSPAGQVILMNPGFFGVTDVETTPSGAVKILGLVKTAADNAIGTADLAS